MYNRIFNKVKGIIPKISETELLALKSGTTSIDREIFKGVVNYPVFKKYKRQFDDEKVDKLCDFIGNQSIYPNKDHKVLLDFIGKNKFLSFIIKEKYGGEELSVREMSSILTKITTKNPALGVTVMVPNSLGPAELLQEYGTERQKDRFLPKLATGDYIPCFGLTGPNNGSDATGSIDEGEVIIERGEKFVRVEINKRYITLGPVANLIGLAVKVKDPFNLLDEGKEGVTVFLVSNKIPGLKQETHHNPLNAGFPNGTLKGTIDIPVDCVIGGEKNVGMGWKMLMECLAAGRGVCLPATANASSKTAMLGVYQYAKHRHQFKMPLIKMEGVQNKLVNMIYETWLIQCSVELTNHLLDEGEKPGVISAIMKQQTTDRARDILNEAMDIHAGGAICLGDNNFLEKFYRAAPIGITVEGSNTLTRNLMIFGQGLNKSHPYIFPILDSILNDDKDSFKNNFKEIIKHSICCYFKALTNYGANNELDKLTLHFANLSNFIALNGGKLKSEQSLSSDMADILSNLYLAHSVKIYEKNYNVSEKLTNYCVDRLCNEIKLKMNTIIDNQKLLKYIIPFSKKTVKSEKYSDRRDIIKELEENINIMEHIKKDIYLKDRAIEDLILLDNIEKDSLSYKILYDKVIQVGEYKNIEPKEVL